MSAAPTIRFLTLAEQLARMLHNEMFTHCPGKWDRCEACKERAAKILQWLKEHEGVSDAIPIAAGPGR